MQIIVAGGIPRIGPVCLKDDRTTGQATGHYIRVNGRGRSPECNYDDGAGEDYRIGTLSKINNIIYCKNDCLQSITRQL